NPVPRHLRSLLWLMAIRPAELADRSLYGRAALIAKLGAVLQAERRRARARHWTYEPARHGALLAAYDHERAAFVRDFGKGDTPEEKDCGPIATGSPEQASL